MAVVRKAGGQLVETQLDGQAPAGSQLAQPTPTTPAGSASAGASPDSAKMSGTPAQKKPVLEEAVKPQQTLQAAQRAQAAQPQAPSIPDQAKAKLGALQGYGHYANRLQAIIESRLQAATQAAPTLQVAEAGLAQYADRPETQAAVRTALTDYLADRSEAKLLKVAEAMGGDPVANLQALKGGGLTSMLQGTDEALAAVGKGFQPVTVAEMAQGREGVEAWQLPQLAADLGVPEAELATMSVDQFQQALTTAIAREGSRTATLQAELQSASPQRAQQIRDELRSLGVSGVLLAETEAKALTDSLDSEEQVTFNGQPTDIQSLLSDDVVSDTIRNAVNNPAALAELAKTEPELAAWITQHSAALKEVTDQIGAQVTAAADVQADWTKTLTEIPDSVRKALGLPEGALTAEQVETYKAQLEGNSLVQALRNDPSGRLAAALQANPGAATGLLNLSAEDITKVLDANAEIAGLSADDKAALQALGLEVPAGFVTDPAQASQLAAMLRATRAAPADVIQYLAKSLPPEALQDPKLLLDTVQVAELANGKDAVLNKLLGLKPGEFPKVKSKAELATLVARAQAMSAAYESLGTLKTDPNLADLVRAGVLDTVSEMELLVDTDGFPRPEVLEQLHASYVEAEMMKAAADLAGEGKGLHAMDRIAQLVVGKGATAKHLAQMIDQSNLVLKNPGMYDADLVGRMKKLQEQLQVLDVTGDGAITRGDIDPDYMPYASWKSEDKAYGSRAAKYNALVAQQLSKMSGDFATDVSDLTKVAGKRTFADLRSAAFPGMNPDEWLKDDPLSILATKTDADAAAKLARTVTNKDTQPGEWKETGRTKKESKVSDRRIKQWDEVTFTRDLTTTYTYGDGRQSTKTKQEQKVEQHNIRYITLPSGGREETEVTTGPTNTLAE